SACAASSARPTRNLTPSQRFTARDTASLMAEDQQADPKWRLRFPFDASLTARILAVNLIPLMLLAGSLFFLDSYRRQLLDERFQLARTEAPITAYAFDGASRMRSQAL